LQASCIGQARVCGPGRDADCAHSCGGSAGNDDCCARILVPASGQTFKRSYDGLRGGSFEDPRYTATVSDFYLDKYEVTVGRFRRFVETYYTPPKGSNKPVNGSGKNSNNPQDPGWGGNPGIDGDSWRVAWQTPDGTGGVWAIWDGAQTGTGINTVLRCAGGQSGVGASTWTNSPNPGVDENRAMNCITWYEAYAFCIWDGGRLATEAEWNFAAQAGPEQRPFPWSAPPLCGTQATPPQSCVVFDATYAVSGKDQTGLPGSVEPVGSRSPKGDGKWGHTDLAGNIEEWVFDWSPTQNLMGLPIPCNDCMKFTPEANPLDQRPSRSYRGGPYEQPFVAASQSTLRASAAGASDDPASRTERTGWRCAYNR
jgi:formylglycine-generating enzyme required for sulfatase activity